MAIGRAETTWSQAGTIAAAAMNAAPVIGKRAKVWQPKDFMPEGLVKKVKPPPGGFEVLKSIYGNRKKKGKAKK